MVAQNSRAEEVSLRDVLRRSTQSVHDRLDATIGSLALDPVRYAGFLSVQYAARAPIERWVAANLAGPLAPPPVAALIARDLGELGAERPLEQEFAFPAGGDPIGLAWALGGSALGNRAILARRRRAGLSGADSFLAETDTPAFFRSILPLLDEVASPARAKAAVAAADAVFATFMAAAANIELKAAA